MERLTITIDSATLAELKRLADTDKAPGELSNISSYLRRLICNRVRELIRKAEKARKS